MRIIDYIIEAIYIASPLIMVHFLIVGLPRFREILEEDDSKN